MKPFNQNSKIYVAGHRGMVGSALVRKLKSENFQNLVLKTRQELDLLNQSEVDAFFKQEKPEFVFLAAARVGGIQANNSFQADFLYENLMIAANVMHSALTHQTEKLLFLGSSCIYPRMAEQPIREESLLTSSLEPTNEGYALAKIAGLKLAEKIHLQYKKRFVSAMPTNLYGPFDNFHPEHSHVIPGMMRRFHEAKIQKKNKVTIWGTGNPKREFLHVDDLAEGCLQIMKHYEEASTLNLGTGHDLSIRELAQLMKSVVGYEGEIEFDPSKPDGTPRKVLDMSRTHKKLDWRANTPLETGLKNTYQWALDNKIF